MILSPDHRRRACAGAWYRVAAQRMMGGDQWSQDYNGTCAPSSRYGSKDVIQHLVQFTKLFSITDLNFLTHIH